MGVYYLGELAADQLTSEAKVKIDDTINFSQYGEVFKLACLLHDVGHAPFSHTGESFYLGGDHDYTKLHEKLIEVIGSTEFEAAMSVTAKYLIKSTDSWVIDDALINKLEKEKAVLEGTITLAIVMDDLDHPIVKGFNHWVAWNLTPSNRIPGSIPKGATIENQIHIEQGIGYGKHGYRGPKPPFNWNHRYRFTVYALDIKIDISVNSKKEKLMEAIENHVLASGIIIGKYQRHHA